MDIKILFRAMGSESREEKQAAETFFDVIDLVAEVKPGDIVIGRYSVLPYYREVDRNIQLLGGELINRWAEHDYIASFGYYEDVEDLTFKSYRRLQDVPKGKPLVIKGQTNSMKWNWETHMFARDRSEAAEVSSRLMMIPSMAEQGLIYREYEPLKTFEVGLNGLRFTNEWRFFFYDEQEVAAGYYWNCASNIPKDVPEEARRLAHKVAERIRDHVCFYSLDVAEKEDGSWVLVEVNDGQMAGLSDIDPVTFYKSLRERMEGCKRIF